MVKELNSEAQEDRGNEGIYFRKVGKYVFVKESEGWDQRRKEE